MRILFQLLDAQLGGGQRLAADVAERLAAHGHAVGVVVPADGPALERFPSAEQHVLDFAGARRPRLRDGARLIRQYDLLYSHTSVPGEIAGSAAALLARRPQLVHRHSFLDFSPRPGHRAVHRLLYRTLVARRPFVAVARHVRDELVALGVDAARIDVVPNGTTIPAQPPPAPSRAPLRVGMLGRLDPAKGAHVFVAAAERSRAGAHWSVTGPAGADPDYVELVQGAAATAGVAVEPARPGSVVLSELDVVAIPSTYEGHPLVLLEALALGRPVVAAAIPGIVEALAGEDAAVLVPPDDPAALAAAVDDLLADGARRALLAARGRALALRDYDVERTLERLVAIVEAMPRRV